MNINSIKKGMKIKNYKEMYTLLCDKNKTGKSKQLQLEDWKRYFEYHREGNSFVIDEIFKVEKIKPARKDNIYTGFIEIILMNQLSLQSDNTIVKTKKQLYQMLGLCNFNYIDAQLNHQALNIIKNATNISDKQKFWYFNQFSLNVNNKSDKILFNALNSMKKRSLIYYTDVYTIVEKKKSRFANDNEV